jgi:hypothetical protein
LRIGLWQRRRRDQAGDADVGEGSANRAINGGPVGLNLAIAVQSAILAAFLDAGGEGDGAFDGFDNIGKVDGRCWAGEAHAAAAAARCDEQACAGQLADQFLNGGAGDLRLFRQFGRLQRHRPALAGGGAHEHHGIIGKVGQSHFFPHSHLRMILNWSKLLHLYRNSGLLAQGQGRGARKKWHPIWPEPH